VEWIININPKPTDGSRREDKKSLVVLLQQGIFVFSTYIFLLEGLRGNEVRREDYWLPALE
jgi:hypothetical protein